MVRKQFANTYQPKFALANIIGLSVRSSEQYRFYNFYFTDFTLSTLLISQKEQR